MTERVTLKTLLMDTLVGIPMVSLVVSTVAILSISLKSVKTIESLLLVVYTGRNSGITSQRLKKEPAPLLIQDSLLTR